MSSTERLAGLDPAAAGLELLLQSLDVPVLALDHELRILFASRAFWQLRRQQPPAGPGTGLLEACPDLAGKSLVLAAREVLSSATPRSLEPTISNNFLGTRLIPWEQGVLLLFEDSKARRELEQLRWELVDGLAHHFMTPLASIVGYAETLLRMREDGDSTQQEFLERIKTRAESLVASSGKLLFLSRLERSPETPRVEVDLRRLALEGLRSVMLNAEGKGIELAASLPDETFIVEADADSLQVAVGNLLDNAIKYSHYGGRVQLRLERLGSEIAVSVSDEGIGMEPEAQAKAFERFYRGDRARTGDYLGAGLGLALVKEIAAAHEGRVELSSVPGQGSVFTIVLPAGGGDR